MPITEITVAPAETQTLRLAIFCAGSFHGVQWIPVDQTGQPPTIITAVGSIQFEYPYSLVTPADAPISVYHSEESGGGNRKTLASVAELVRVLSGIPNVSVDHDAQMQELRAQLLATVANAEELLQGRDTKIDRLEFRIEKIIQQARDWKGKTLRRDLYIESWRDENVKLASKLSQRDARATAWEAVAEQEKRAAKHARDEARQAEANAHDLREHLRETQVSALDTIQKVVANLSPPVVDGIDVISPDLDVDTWFSADDNIPVVQIDTPRHAGRLRVNLNDGVIWDGDPAEDERPGKHAERLPHEEIGVVDPVTLSAKIRLPDGLAEQIRNATLHSVSLVDADTSPAHVEPGLLEEIVKLPEGLQPNLPSTLPEGLVANKLTGAFLRPMGASKREMMLRSEIVDGVGKIHLSREEFQGHVEVTLDGNDLVEANIAAIDEIRDKDDRIVALKAERDVEEARANSAESQLITATNELEKVQETRAELRTLLSAAQRDHANASRTAHAHLDEAERLRGALSTQEAVTATVSANYNGLLSEVGALTTERDALKVDLHNANANADASASALTVCQARLSESEEMRRKLDTRLEEERAAYVAGSRALEHVIQQYDGLAQIGESLAKHAAGLGTIFRGTFSDAQDKLVLQYRREHQKLKR